MTALSFDCLSLNGTNEIQQFIFFRQPFPPMDDFSVYLQYWREGDVSQNSLDVRDVNNISIYILFGDNLPDSLVKLLAEIASRTDHLDCDVTRNFVLCYIYVLALYPEQGMQTGCPSLIRK